MEIINNLNTTNIVNFIGNVFAYIGLMIMTLGVLKSAYLMIIRFFDKKISISKVRLKLGHYLILSLEFLVAKDILESIFDPTMDRLIKLSIIVAIRTVLTYFLNKELSEIKSEMDNQKVK